MTDACTCPSHVCACSWHSMLCKTCTCIVQACLPASASNRNQGLAGWQLTSVLYMHFTVSDPAISLSAIQPFHQALQISASLVIRFWTVSWKFSLTLCLYSLNHWLIRGIGFQTSLLLQLLTVSTEVTVNGPAVELSCVQCADPVFFWSGHLGGIVRHMHPVCQQHLPQQVSKAS